MHWSNMAENTTVPENLQCPLCFDLFEKATLLTCGHTFCKKCLVDYDKTQATSEFMSCPLCRKPTTMPREDRVRGLAANVTVNALVDDLKQAQSATLGLQKMTVSSKEPEEDSLKVLRMLELPAGVRGMARLSDDTVVIGYGSSKSGADAVSISGAKKQYLEENIGPVRDISFLSDGRPVVSHGKDVIRVYNNEGFPTDIQFYTQEKCTNYKICIGRTDEVYAVNWTNSIFIFQQGKETPSKVVYLGDQYAIDVGVTTAEMIIIRCHDRHITSKNTIAMWDRYGHKGSVVAASEEQEFLFAAVDSRDRVFLGRIFPNSGKFNLSIYTIEGQSIKEKKKFNVLYLPGKEIALVGHHMVCLTPTLIAIGNMDKELYFIKVPRE